MYESIVDDLIVENNSHLIPSVIFRIEDLSFGEKLLRDLLEFINTSVRADMLEMNF